MTQPWHEECRRLRAEGLSQREISLRLKKPLLIVRAALNETVEQAMIFRRAKERERQRKPRDRTPKKNGGRFQTHWAPRAAAPGVITLEIKREACLAFVRGEIDRVELMKRITPRDKWSKVGLLRVE